MNWRLLIAFGPAILLGIGGVVVTLIAEAAKREEKRQGAAPPAPSPSQQP